LELMSALALTLLGRPQIRLDGQLTTLASNKALGLLYYLAATGQVHSRQMLAGLFWSDLPEEAARRNLRVELNRLRSLFDSYLVGERETLAFHKAAPHWLDLDIFEACRLHPNPSIEQLQRAVDLYQGDFLQDFHVRDAALFEEWLDAERERLHQVVQQFTLRLLRLLRQEHRYDTAILYAQRLLARNAWLEEGHQELMTLYALTGQRAKALAQYELCSDALDNEFGVPPSEATNQLYDQILSGEIRPPIEAFPQQQPNPMLTPPRPSAPPFQAPAPLLHFVGREGDLAAVYQALVQPETATYAIVGMGGVGKSIFAVHVAHALRSEFADGVLWAHAATSDPMDILGNWARALGYDFSGLADVENRAAALRGVLAEKRVLLVLDDVRSVARTRPLLLGGARCTTLITTRDLDVATALNAKPYRLQELAPAESVHLLERILGEERVAAEREAAQQIGLFLQNLPLAVEITAQRLASRPRRRLADMAQRLRSVEERLDLSISDRAVRTSFMVSWESLDANLRRTFSLLAVFAGRSFTAPALAHIAGLDTYTAEDRLFALTTLSLSSEEGDDRYRQHPLLADFAREQLGENTLPLVDMAFYYQQFAERHRTDYPALRPEWENLMAGMAAAHHLEQWALVLGYADTLTHAWFVRARYAQARLGYNWARDAAQALGDESALASALLRWGQACVEQDDYTEAEQLLTESLKYQEKAQDAAGIASVKYYLARIAVDQARYATAEQLLVSSQQLCRRLGDQGGLATTMYQEALLGYRLGDLDKAKALCEQALVLQEEINDQGGLLPTLRLLADVALEQKEYAIADAYCQRALTLGLQLQNRGELAQIYYSLTVVARVQENFELAHTYAANALELCQWMGNLRIQAAVRYEQCWLYATKKEYEAAIQVGLKSLELFRQLKDNFNLVYVLCHLGDFYEESGQHEAAYRLWQEASNYVQSQNHPLQEPLHQRLTSH
jgi:DNA-binding SARP family transcriptional activator